MDLDKLERRLLPDGPAPVAYYAEDGAVISVADVRAIIALAREALEMRARMDAVREAVEKARIRLPATLDGRRIINPTGSDIVTLALQWHESRKEGIDKAAAIVAALNLLHEEKDGA